MRTKDSKTITCLGCKSQHVDPEIEVVDEVFGAKVVPQQNLLETSKKSQKAIENEMGSYMLKGWVMMNECCSSCNVPLMRTKDRSSIICVGCNTDFAKDVAERVTHVESNVETELVEAESNNNVQQVEKAESDLGPDLFDFKSKDENSKSLDCNHNPEITSLFSTVLDKIKTLQVAHFTASPKISTLGSVFRILSSAMDVVKSIKHKSSLDIPVVHELLSGLGNQINTLDMMILECEDLKTLQVLFDCSKDAVQLYNKIVE